MIIKNPLAKTVLILALLGPAKAEPAPEQLLQEASQYTVRIKTLGNIALNKDEGGSLSGTGFLIDQSRGWILTNAHVVTRSPVKIEISFKGGAPIAAERVHVDAFIDMAIIKIPVSSIPKNSIAARLDCSQLPKSGSSVFAYGHPWGIPYTATRGIVSGNLWYYPHEYIQHDATINSGNSGGPLINTSTGEVVGINSSDYRSKEDKAATAVGLAEPIPAICKIIDLLRDGKDARLKVPAFATATAGDDIRPRVALAYKEAKDFQPSDIIVKVNGSGPVQSLPDLLDRLRGLQSKATITVERDGALYDFVTPLLTKSDPLQAKSISISGLVISDVWKLDEQELNPNGFPVVDWIENEKPAILTKAKIGDYLISVNGLHISSVSQLIRYFSDSTRKEKTTLILRGKSAEPDYVLEYREVTIAQPEVEVISVIN
jgi:S1-C subfamily serine protease